VPNCDLWRNATQTVLWGMDSRSAHHADREVPGDQRINQGKPFVGPAGTLLRAILNEAGIDLNQVYLTNVVKHLQVGGHAENVASIKHQMRAR